MVSGPQTGTSCDLDDGHACTAGLCEDGSCTVDVVDGCFINGQCVDEGADNPDNNCQMCNSAISDTSWTDKSDGTGCDPEDGLSCTSGFCDSGSCVAEIDSGCLIDGACYADGDENPTNECQVCSSTVSEDSWTDRSDGFTCDPGNGLSCTTGSCEGGS